MTRVRSKQQAREIAAAVCAGRDWPFEEPVHVSWGLFNYEVRTNAMTRGGNVTVRIRKRDGQVVAAGIASR